MNWDYVAGFFDGEGHVGIHCSRKKWQHQYISISNTHHPTMVQMASFLRTEGINCSVYSHVKGSWQRLYTIRVLGLEGAKLFLEKLQPRCVTKTKAITKVLAYTQTKVPRLRYKPDHYKAAIAFYESGASQRDVQKAFGISPKMLRTKAKQQMRSQKSGAGLWRGMRRVVTTKRGRRQAGKSLLPPDLEIREMDL